MAVARAASLKEKPGDTGSGPVPGVFADEPFASTFGIGVAGLPTRVLSLLTVLQFGVN